MFLEGKIKNYNSERGFGFITVDEESQDIFFHIKDFPSWHIKPNMGELLKFRVVEEHGKFKAAEIVRLDLKTMDELLIDEPNSLSIKTEHIPVQLVKSKTSTTKYAFFAVLILALISIFGFMFYQQIQEERVAKQLKAEQLIQEQKKIVEQQRAALGALPDHILSAQGRKNLEKVGHTVNEQQVNTGSIVNSLTTPEETQVSEQVSNFKCDGRTHCGQMHSYEEAVFFLRNCPSTEMDGDGDGIPCERQFHR